MWTDATTTSAFTWTGAFAEEFQQVHVVLTDQSWHRTIFGRSKAWIVLACFVVLETTGDVEAYQVGHTNVALGCSGPQSLVHVLFKTNVALGQRTGLGLGVTRLAHGWSLPCGSL